MRNDLPSPSIQACAGFVTTFPIKIWLTGQACPVESFRRGTGLGLSLSYEIIKAHGGEIKVETKEGEGREFTIQLPKA